MFCVSTPCWANCLELPLFPLLALPVGPEEAAAAGVKLHLIRRYRRLDIAAAFAESINTI